METLEQQVLEIHRNFGGIRETLGELRGETRAIAAAVDRLSGTVEAQQQVNQTAHARHDDRLALYSGAAQQAIGETTRLRADVESHEARLRGIEGRDQHTEGAGEARRRWGEWVKLVVAGAVGSLVAFGERFISAPHH